MGYASAMSKRVLPLLSACTIVAENLTFFIMIDTTQLTQLISAFRVETEKESISPETVGSLLQNITDLLANASCGVFLMLSRHHAIHYLCAHARSLTYCHPLYNCSSALRLKVIVTSKPNH